MKHLRALLAAGFLAASGGVALADPAITVAPTSMLSAPNPKSRVLLHIPANAEVDVISCQRAWCEVSWRNQFGYAPQKNLDIGAIPEDGMSRRAYRGPVYAPPPVYDYPPPAVYGGGIYIGPRPRVWSYGW